MNEERREVYRGHLEECLRHLESVLTSKALRESAQVKKLIADFCGVTADSVNRWLKKDGPIPIGEPLIRLICCLDMVGYSVIELERTPQSRRGFIELIGYRVFTSDQAFAFLGYSSPSGLYRILWGHSGVSEEKNQKMWDGWKERREELQLKKEESKKLYGSSILSKITPAAVAPSASVLPLRSKAVVAVMEGLLILFEERSLEEFSEAELANLNQSISTISNLSERLSALKSQLVEYSSKN